MPPSVSIESLAPTIAAVSAIPVPSIAAIPPLEIALRGCGRLDAIVAHDRSAAGFVARHPAVITVITVITAIVPGVVPAAFATVVTVRVGGALG